MDHDGNTEGPTMTTVKRLAEMTTSELETLKADAYEAIRKVHRMWGDMPVSDPRWSDIHESRQAMMRMYHRIDDELDRRGA